MYTVVGVALQDLIAELHNAQVDGILYLPDRRYSDERLVVENDGDLPPSPVTVTGLPAALGANSTLSGGPMLTQQWLRASSWCCYLQGAQWPIV